MERAQLAASMTGFDVRGYSAAWNTHDVDLLLDYSSNDVEVVEPNSGAVLRGKDKLREGLESVIRAFPDVNGDIEKALLQGREVAFLLHITGTNTGEYSPPPPQKPYPATGKRARWAHAGFLTLDAEGKIAREVDLVDMANFLAQLGVATPPPGEKREAATRRS